MRRLVSLLVTTAMACSLTAPAVAGVATLICSTAEAEAKAEAEKKKEELKAKIRDALRAAMNKAFDEATARGGASFDAAVKMARAQGLEQLYAKEIQEAANVGFVFYTEGADKAYDERLSQLSQKGLSTAVLGYVAQAMPALGAVLAVCEAVRTLLKFDFSAAQAHCKRDYRYDQIREQIVASFDSVMQAQYLNLEILWRTFRALNGLEPTTSLNPWNMCPSGPVSFDQIFQAVLTKKGGYDSQMWGTGEHESIEFKPEYGFWGSRWIQWSDDPDEDVQAFYAQEVTRSYMAFKMTPLNETSNHVAELLFTSIDLDLRKKREAAAEVASAVEAVAAARAQAAHERGTEWRITRDANEAQAAAAAAHVTLRKATTAAGRGPNERVARLLASIQVSVQEADRRAALAQETLAQLKRKLTIAQLGMAVRHAATHRAAAKAAAASAERDAKAIPSARNRDQQEVARAAARPVPAAARRLQPRRVGAVMPATVHLISATAPVPTGRPLRAIGSVKAPSKVINSTK